MRRISYVVVIAAGLLGAVLLVRSCGSSTEGYVREAARDLPEDTVLLLAVDSLARVVGTGDEPAPYPGFREAIEEEYGWQREQLDDLTELGLDVDAPIGLALLEVTRPVFVTSLGFNGDRDDLRRGLVEVAELSEEQLDDRVIGGYEGLLIDNAHAAFIRDGRLISVSAYDGWLDWSVAADLETVATRVAERSWEESADNAEAFGPLTQLDRPTEGMLLVNVKAALQQLMTASSLPLFVARIDLVGFSAGLGRDENERYLLHRVLFSEDSRLPDRLLGPPRSAEPLERIPGPLVAGAHLSMNPSGLLDALELLPLLGAGGNDLIREVRWFSRDVLSVDLEEDLGELLSGEIGVFVRRIPQIDRGEVEAMAFLGVVDEAEARRLVETAVDFVRANAAAQVEVDGSTTRFAIAGGPSGAVEVADGYIWLLIGDETQRAASSGDATPFTEEDDRLADLFAEQWIAASYVDAAAVATNVGAGVFEWYFELGGESIDTVTYVLERDGELFRGTLEAELSASERMPVQPPVAPLGGGVAGSTRVNPLPPGAALEVDGWTVRANDWERLDGFPADHDQSYQAIAESESVIRVALEATCAGGFRQRYELHGYQITLTGERGHAYSPADGSALDGRVERNGAIYEGERHLQTHLHYVVPRYEGHLILVAESSVEPLFGERHESCQFVALEDGAAALAMPETGESTSTAQGTWDDPVPLGEWVESGRWRVSVTEVFRGEVAQRLRREAGSYRSEMSEGRDRLQMHLVAERLGDGSCSAELGTFAFDVADAAGERHYTDVFYTLDPRLSVDVYPGARASGWLSADVPDDVALRLVWREGVREVYFDVAPANLTNPFTGPGYTAQNPAPRGTAVDSGGWAVRVDEVVRGAAALARLESQSDSPFGITPPDGREYLLVGVHVESSNTAHGALRRHDLPLLDSSGAAIGPVYWPRYQPALDRVEAGAPPADLWLVYEVPPAQSVQLTIDRPQQRFLAIE